MRSFTYDMFWFIYPIMFFCSVGHYLIDLYINYLSERKFWLVARKRKCIKIKEMLYCMNILMVLVFILFMIIDLILLLSSITNTLLLGGIKG